MQEGPGGDKRKGKGAKAPTSAAEGRHGRPKGQKAAAATAIATTPTHPSAALSGKKKPNAASR